MRTPLPQSPLPFVPLLLRRDLAASYLGMSPSTFDAEVKAGRLPKPIRITNTLKGWHRADLDAWADNQRAKCEADGDGSSWDRVLA